MKYIKKRVEIIHIRMEELYQIFDELDDISELVNLLTELNEIRAFCKHEHTVLTIYSESLDNTPRISCTECWADIRNATKKEIDEYTRNNEI